MSRPGELQAALDKGLAYLAASQVGDGSFLSVSSPQQQPFTAGHTYRTIFAPAIILGALNNVTIGPAHQAVRARLAAWLLSQKSPQWSFNYWAQDAPERQTLPYPDDLDDTLCALLALHGYKEKLIDGACLGAVARLLVATESQVGGPYRTWLVSSAAPPVWHDIDLAVNSNVAAFLCRIAEPLPHLNALLEKAIKNKSYASPYYPSSYPIWYYMARAYRGPLRAKLTAHILEARRGDAWQTPQQTALALSALRHLECTTDVEPAKRYLLETQQPDGAWAAEAFCLDPAQGERQYYNGAAALTTALCLEALSAVPPQKTPRDVPTSQRSNKIKQYRTASAEAAALPLPLRVPFKKLLAGMEAGDPDGDIILLPHLAAKSLEDSPAVPEETLDNLGLATLYGWMAYTIYDNFIDDEGQPVTLPAATAALRKCLQHFQLALPSHKQFQQQAVQIFDRIDAANTRELTDYRLHVHKGEIQLAGPMPTYPGSLWLAERSLGHTLAPLGVLAAAGHDLHSQAAKDISLAIRHYLAARQLSDDLHDWQDDLRAGHATYVVAALLRDHQLKPGAYPVAKLVSDLQHTFWRHSLSSLCRTLLGHVSSSRRAIRRSGLCREEHFLTKSLASLETSAHHTLQEQRSAKDFLHAYRYPQ